MVKKKQTVHLIDGNEATELENTEQSANSIFHFYKEFDFLFDAIESRLMKPRYFSEDVEYLNIGRDRLSYPMVCFCDISMHKLKFHMNRYGRYGLAFSKKWGIEKGVQPLHYINPQSVLIKDFQETFKQSLKDSTIVSDYLITDMIFMKPIQGTMIEKDVSYTKNFTDECEWRFVPDVKKIDIPLIVEDVDEEGVGILNSTISNHEECCLKFDYSDIRYIFLKDEDDFIPFCNKLSSLSIDSMTRDMLISKIIFSNTIQEDI